MSQLIFLKEYFPIKFKHYLTKLLRRFELLAELNKLSVFNAGIYHHQQQQGEFKAEIRQQSPTSVPSFHRGSLQHLSLSHQFEQIQKLEGEIDRAIIDCIVPSLDKMSKTQRQNLIEILDDIKGVKINEFIHFLFEFVGQNLALSICC